MFRKLARDAPAGRGLRDLNRSATNTRRFAARTGARGRFRRDARRRRPDFAYLDSASDRPFIVHGVSGSGKSALMAAAAARRPSVRGDHCRAIPGNNKRSSDLRSLLIDLCQSLREHFPLADELPTDVRLMERSSTGNCRTPRPSGPVYVFLDALDQLDPADDAHRLWWIRSTPLPPHARLVVSCLSDSRDEARAVPGPP